MKELTYGDFPGCESLEAGSVQHYRLRTPKVRGRGSKQVHNDVKRCLEEYQLSEDKAESAAALVGIAYNVYELAFLLNFPWARMFWLYHRCRLEGREPTKTEVLRLVFNEHDGNPYGGADVEKRASDSTVQCNTCNVFYSPGDKEKCGCPQ